MNDVHIAPGIDWGYTLSLAGIVTLVVLAVGIWIGRTTKRRPQPAPAATPSDPDVIDRLAAQRVALIGGCVQTRGLLDDQVLTDVLDDALRRGGVQVVDPTGSRATPAQHRIAGTEPTEAPDQDGVISRILRPGFLDAGRVIRAADVVVYKWGK